MCLKSWGNKCKLLPKSLIEMSTHLYNVMMLFALIRRQACELKKCTSGFAYFGPLTRNCTQCCQTFSKAYSQILCSTCLAVISFHLFEIVHNKEINKSAPIAVSHARSWSTVRNLIRVSHKDTWLCQQQDLVIQSQTTPSVVENWKNWMQHWAIIHARSYQTFRRLFVKVAFEHRLLDVMRAQIISAPHLSALESL